ncbi:OmpA family protein [Xanthobacter sp. V2C-8]|uniref:OmpA family protein n=1 Tax=Xanthobacter albus TaxID=3119929 RepID=UPI00372AA153
MAVEAPEGAGARPAAAEGAGGQHAPVGAGRWRPWVLALGLLALSVLAVATLMLARRPIEEDLSRSAEAVLARSGESWATAQFEGRDATLEGESLAEEARAKVRASLENMFGVRTVRDATTLLPERRPFTFSAVKDGRMISLDGYVPSRYALARIVAAVKASGNGITGQDRLVRARGAPAGDFASLVEFALGQLVRLPSGRITLSDGALAIEGRAPDLSLYASIAQTVRGPLPYGMTLARFAVRPPVASPFVWSASREGETLRVSGFVPSDAARDEVTKVLKAALPGVTVRDDTRLADGAPSADLWLKAVAYAARMLAAVPQLQVTLSDSAIAVEGMASTFDAFEVLAAARKAPPEGFQVTRFAVEPPRAVPFTWELVRTADGVRMSGYVPSEEARRLLLEALRSAFPGVPVEDGMRLASGGPAAEIWSAGANFAVAQLARLRAGRVKASGAALVLSGEALDSATYQALTQAMKALPAGLSATADAVEPPRISPYVFAVRRDGDGLTVSGFFPDEKAHQALLQALERDFLKEKVNDLTAIGGGAPAGFLQAALAGLGQLARVANGELTLTDTQLRLAGAALRGSVAGEVEDELKRALKPPFAAETALEVAAPGALVGAQECQGLISDLLGRGTILFDTGSARIDRHSLGLLDRLAFVLQRCPSAVVEVAGHTDAVGDASVNQKLSEARAAAVAAFLAEAGIARERLSTVGHGAAQPVAENDTEAGRALNRRIVFTVKEGRGP